MSREIDEKIVEMRFENENFESNAQQSMSTLEKLKNALNFGGVSDSFADIDSAINDVDFDPLNGGINTVSTSFHALEEVAVGALWNIGAKVSNLGTDIIKNLTVDQLTAGWTKYEQKTASVQTILNATGKTIEEVNGYLNKLMWYSDETSYGFTDMTTALGQLTAVGGDIETVIPMIEGMANATAYAGKGASEFQRVIYNLTQSYGQGYITLLDWKSVQQANVASKELVQTLIDTGVELGKIQEGEVTVSNFATTLKDKWADTEVMEAAFGKFATLTEAAYELVDSGQFDTAKDAMDYLSGQYGEIAEKSFRAAQEAKSFTEAIDATKDAVSSGWLKTFEIIFGDYEEAKVLWSDLTDILWDIFASGADARNEFLEGALSDSSKIITKDKWEGITAGVEYSSALESAMKKTAKSYGIDIDSMIEEQGSFAATLDDGWLSWDMFSEALLSVDENIEPVNVDFESLLGTYKDLAAQIVKGDFGNGAERVERLAEAGYDYATAQKIVNKTLAGQEVTIEDVMELTADMSDAQLIAAGYTQEEVDALRALAAAAEETGTPMNKLVADMTKPSGRELIFDSIYNAYLGLSKIFGTVKEAWNETFKAMTSDDLHSIIESVNEFSQSLIISDDAAYALTDAFAGVFSVVRTVAEAFKTVVSVLSKLTPIVTGVIRVITSAAGLLGRFVTSINNAITASDIFGDIAWGLGDIVGVVADVFNFLCEVLASVIDEFTEFGIADDIYYSLKNVAVGLSKVFSDLSDAVYSATEYLLNFLFGVDGGVETIRNAGVNITTVVSQIKESIIGFFEAIKETSGVQSLMSSIEHLKSAFSTIVKIIGDAVVSAVESIGQLLGESEFFEDLNIGDVLVGIVSLIAGAMATFIDTVLGALETISKSGLFQAVINKFTDLWNAITYSDGEQPSKVQTAFGFILDIVNKLFEVISQGISSADVVNGFSNFVQEVIDSFRSLNNGVFAILSPAVEEIKSLLGGDQALVNIVGLIELELIIKALTDFRKALAPLGTVTDAVTSLIKKFGTVLQSLADSVRIQSLGSMLKDVAIAITLLVGSIIAISFVDDPTSLTTAIAVVELLIFTMGALATSMSKLKGTTQNISFAAVILAIDTLIFSVKSLSKIDTSALNEGLRGAITIMGSLALMAAAISGLNANISVVATALIELAVAVDLLVIPVAAFALIPFESLMQGLIGLVATMAALGGMAYVLEGVTANIIPAAAAMILLAAAIDLLIPAIIALALPDPNKLLPNVAAVAALIAIVAVASPALTAVAAACAALTAALAVIVVTIPLAVVAMNGLFTILKSLKGFDAPIDKLAAGFIALLAAIALSASVVPILTSLGMALISIGGGIAIATAAVAAFAVVSVLFSKFATSIAAGAEALILTVCTVIQNTGPVIIQTVLGLIDSLLEALADHAYTIVMSLIHILSEILKALLDVIVGGLGDLGHTIMSALGFEGTFFDQMFQSWNEAANKSVSEHYAEGIEEGASSKNLTDATQKVTDKVTDGLEDGGEDIEDSGTDNTKDYLSGFTDSKILKSLMNSSGDIPIDQIAAMAKSSGLFGDLSDDEVSELLGSWDGAGKSLGKEASSEIKEAADKAEKATNGAWADVGEETVLGIIEGLKSSNPVVVQSSKNLIYRILGYTQDAAEINSPSLLFKEEVGEYIVDGIAEGIEDNMSAEEAAAQKAQNISDAFQEALDKIDLDIDITDAEWEKYAAAFDDVTEANDYFTKRAETIAKKITSQTEAVTLARNEYNVTLAEFGEASEYTKEAYLKMIQAETDLISLQKELDDLAVEQYEQMKETYDKKTDLINQYIDIAEKEQSLAEATYGDVISDEASKYLNANSALKSYSKTLSKVKNLQEKYNAVLADEHATQEDINDAYADLLDARTDLVTLAGDFAEAFGMGDVATSLLTNVTNAISGLTTNPKLAAAASGLSTMLTKLVGEKAANGITNGVDKFFNGGGTDILANALTLATSIASGDAANAITASFQLVGSLAGTEFGQAITSKIWTILTSGDSGGFVGTIKSALSKVSGIFDSSGISGIVSNLGAKIGSWFNQSTGTAIGEEGSGGGILGVIKTAVSNVASKLNASGIFEIISSIGSTIGSWLAKAFAAVLNGGEGLLSIIKNVISGIFSFFSSDGGIIQTVTSIGSTVGNFIKTGFTTVLGNGEATTGLAAVASKAFNAVTSVVGTVSNGGLGTALAGLAAKFGSLGTSIANMASGAVTALGSLGSTGLIVAGGIVANGGIHWAVGKLRDKLNEAKQAAEESGNSLKTFFLNVGNSVLNFVDSMTIPGIISNVTNIGSNLVTGLVNGVKSVASTAWNAVKSVGSGIISGFKSLFGIHSPSTVMAGLGEYISLGLAQGIEDGSDTNADSVGVVGSAIKDGVSGIINSMQSMTENSAELGTSVIESIAQGIRDGTATAVSSVDDTSNTIKSAISSLIENVRSMTEDIMDINPVITPVVDMTEVQNGASEIDEMLSSTSSITGILKSITSQTKSIVSSTLSSSTSSGTGMIGQALRNGTQFIFNQYNTSPKSLSAIEIYRQTNNQFASLKEMVTE